MAATFFGNHIDNAPAHLMAQGAKNAHITHILCGFFHTGYC